MKFPELKKRTAVFFIAVLGLISAGLVLGWVQPIFYNDSTYLTYAIVAVLLFLTFFESWQEWAREHGLTLLLGLLGTVIGFSTALTGVVETDPDLKQKGVETALNTTIVGLLGHLYLIILQQVKK